MAADDLTIKLDWKGPFRLPDDLAGEKIPAGTGVYAWAWPDHSIISYVGYAESIWNRHREHVTCMLGGAYALERSPRDYFWTQEHQHAGRQDADAAGSLARILFVLNDPTKAIGEVAQYLEHIRLFIAITGDRARARTAEWLLQKALGLDRRGSRRAFTAEYVRNNYSGPDPNDYQMFNKTLGG